MAAGAAANHSVVLKTRHPSEAGVREWHPLPVFRVGDHCEELLLRRTCEPRPPVILNAQTQVRPALNQLLLGVIGAFGIKRGGV